MDKLLIRFYFVDGSEQYNTIKTDSVELAIDDYRNRITTQKWIELPDDNGLLVLVNTNNIINVEFKRK
ncbi:hypothetical protein D1B33_07520 [Lysinibacillus yapensis]|uniref:Uncharacterized protein n=1 Tax=Ureibacillus yapensis TaxID=2304605 RepID=A0A396SCA0_9BACL|nr:hypothetical protein [Lysinibacillus yapensis]RHW38713.1 hypothetical protein D1B33_07520 [Lysinibacillus yapensis]